MRPTSQPDAPCAAERQQLGQALQALADEARELAATVEGAHATVTEIARVASASHTLVNRSLTVVRDARRLLRRWQLGQ